VAGECRDEAGGFFRGRGGMPRRRTSRWERNPPMGKGQRTADSRNRSEQYVQAANCSVTGWLKAPALC